MPQYRKDPLSDCWVIIAEGREQRPNEFESPPRRRIARRCPFCASHEADTPPAVAEYFPPDAAAGDPWAVRVVPNKYPALGPDPAPLSGTSPFYQSRPALGAHEVIVESPRHVSSFTELTDTEASLLMVAYRDRILHLQRDGRFQYALVFKNLGPEGGASLEHAHSQVVATPDIPPEVHRELMAAQQWSVERGHCFFCQMVDHELQVSTRVVAQTDAFVALCPFASRMPFEIWILPRQHASHFTRQPARCLPSLARFLRQTLTQLESAQPHVAYNYFIHTGPFDTAPLDHYHWHIEILPRLTITAGFEWGTGYFINPVPPEEAAAILRTGRSPQQAESKSGQNRKTS